MRANGFESVILCTSPDGEVWEILQEGMPERKRFCPLLKFTKVCKRHWVANAEALLNVEITREKGEVFMRKACIVLLSVVMLSVMIGASAWAEFDWKAHSGTEIKLMLNKHPYADALVAHLDEFVELTGIQVTYDIFPEDEYFDKVTVTLSSKSSEYSVFMTGAYQVWQYAPPGYMEDLKTLYERSEQNRARVGSG